MKASNRFGARARQRVVLAFEERFQQPPEVLIRAPGRVNVLGGHIDYNQGLVLPGAIERAVWLAASPRTDRQLELVALDRDAEARLDLDRLARPLDRRGPNQSDGAHWSDYPSSIAWVLQREGFELGGIRAVYGGDLPIGAGVSSSAAVEVAFILAWQRLSRLPEIEARELAAIAQRAENDYLGVGSGIMDPLASLAGRRDHLLLIDCRDLGFRALELPPSCRILIADSGVERQLADSGYNDRRSECQQALELLRRHHPELTALRDVPDVDSQAMRALPAHLRRRVQHVVEECARVQSGAIALERGDLETLGRLMQSSHRSSAELYEVSIPELDLLATAALDIEGCHGARLSGAGFGGCVILLVDEASLGEVEQRLSSAFEARFSRRCELLRCRLDHGAELVQS